MQKKTKLQNSKEQEKLLFQLNCLYHGSLREILDTHEYNDRLVRLHSRLRNIEEQTGEKNLKEKTKTI